MGVLQSGGPGTSRGGANPKRAPTYSRRRARQPSMRERQPTIAPKFSNKPHEIEKILGRTTIVRSNFLENCMKIKTIAQCVYVDPPLLHFMLTLTILGCVPTVHLGPHRRFGGWGKGGGEVLSLVTCHGTPVVFSPWSCDSDTTVPPVWVILRSRSILCNFNRNDTRHL